jgi:hypothetical protein
VGSGRFLQVVSALLVLGLAPDFKGRLFAHEPGLLDPWRTPPVDDLATRGIQPIGMVDSVQGSELFDPWSSDSATTAETVPMEVLIDPWARQSIHP